MQRTTEKVRDKKMYKKPCSINTFFKYIPCFIIFYYFPEKRNSVLPKKGIFIKNTSTKFIKTFEQKIIYMNVNLKSISNVYYLENSVCPLEIFTFSLN